MIKKLIFLFVASAIAIIAPAQTAVGAWKLYTPFSGVSDMAETDAYVYYLSAGSCYRIDKSTFEVGALNVSNSLHDASANGIYADATGKSVVVTYATGNMDRLYDNGKIVNMSDVKDAISMNSRNINDMAFASDRFYVATDFGLITYSNSKNEVMETMFTESPVLSVGASAETVALGMDTRLFVAPASQRIKKLSDLTEITSVQQPYGTLHSIDVLGADMIFMVQNNYISRVKLAGDNYADSEYLNWFGIEGYGKNQIFDVYANRVNKVDDKLGYCLNADGLFELGSDGSIKMTGLTKPDKNTDYLYQGSLASVWEGSTAGVRQMDYTAATPAEKVGYITGSEISIPEIHELHAGPSGKIYMNMIFRNEVKGFVDNSIPAKVLTLKDGKFEDVTGYDVEYINNHKGGLKPPYSIYNIFKVKEDPQDPDAYYVGTFYEGIYHIKNNKQIHKYDFKTAGFPYRDEWSCIVYDFDIDKFGNLWAYSNGNNNEDTNKRLFVLPSDKRNKAQTTPDDWKGYALPGVITDYWCNTVIACTQSNRVIMTHGHVSKRLFVVDTKGTASVNDDQVIVVEHEIDQDGKEWPLTFGFFCGVEDKLGRVWIGTDVGLFEITDPDKITSSTISIRRQKVSRNDGTNLADYLLDNTVITNIAVDSSNRKWISTKGSGVYLVSPDGDAILEHYTTDNSILPSNNVNSVVCDPFSNKVYFATSSGLIEYSSTSSPGADSYDDVYAFPNPVRPDYGGWITVTGLMENSLVKIADSAGNVVHQGKSDGGMFVWNGCNPSGERVRSGIYYVLASQNATGSAEACVTKIMVIN